MPNLQTSTTANADSGTQTSTADTPHGLNIWVDGLWRNNAGTVQLLGLCPLLAVSNSVANAFVLGLATLATLLVSNLLVSLIRDRLQAQNRILLYVLIIATTVTIVDIVLQALMPAMHMTLGLFIPLIVTNCMIVGRAEIFASRNPMSASVIDALATGLGFLILLCLIGGIREFAGVNGLLIALLPPGAFFALALILVAKNLIDK